MDFHIFLYLIFIYVSKVFSCQTLVPVELLNSCTFDSLTMIVPSTGFTINRDCCNDVVSKREFSEQPYVYFNNANEVKLYNYVIKYY